MPRKTKKQSTAITSPGQPYGVAGDQQAAMAQIPLPDNSSSPLPVPPSGQGAPGSAPTAPEAPAPAGSSLAEALQAAFAEAPPSGALDDPVPDDEPIMAMPARPPAPPSPVVKTLRAMAAANGNDPTLLALADDAARKGY